MNKFWLPLSVLWLMCSSCQTDFRTLEPFSEGGIHAVIEMPAGTDLWFKYESSSGKILPIMEANKQKALDFLPFPANFGFIPGTNDYDMEGSVPLKVLVLGSYLSTGTIVEAQLIGVLNIRERGLENKFLIASTLGRGKQAKIKDFRDFLLNQDAVKRLLEEWFVHYQGLPDTQILGWQDEKAAMDLIEQSRMPD